jgi:hypothetical protein
MSAHKDDEARGLGRAWLPKVRRKAESMEQFLGWATSAEMKPVFDNLAECIMRLDDHMEPEQLFGKKCMWLLLAVESVCRQEDVLKLGQNHEAEMAEGVGIMMEMVLAAGGAYGKREPFKDKEFWRDFIIGICMAWGGPATMLKLDPERLYAVQIRQLRDSQAS